MHCLWEHWEHWVGKNYLPPGALKRVGAILVVAPLAFVDFARGAAPGGRCRIWVDSEGRFS